MAPARLSKRYERGGRPSPPSDRVQARRPAPRLRCHVVSDKVARPEPPANRWAEAATHTTVTPSKLSLVTKDPAGSPSSPTSMKRPSSDRPRISMREDGGDEIRCAGPTCGGRRRQLRRAERETP